MATLSELRSEVRKIIQDSSFSNDDIDSYLNRGLLEVAGGIQRIDSYTLTQPLPGLFTIGEVTTTTTNHVSLPSDYHRELVYVYNNTCNVEIVIFDSFMEFVRSYTGLNNSGSITGVAVKGNILYYQAIPENPETLIVHYYRYPVDMISDTDEPDGLPKNFHIPILVNYACKEIFSLIEDGIDNAMPNTTKYENKFMSALMRLDSAIPADAPPYRMSCR